MWSRITAKVDEVILRGDEIVSPSLLCIQILTIKCRQRASSCESRNSCKLSRFSVYCASAGYRLRLGSFALGPPHERCQEPGDGVYGKNGHERIDGVAIANRGVRDVVRDRKQEQAQRQR